MFQSGLSLYHDNNNAASQRRVDHEPYALNRSRNHSGYAESGDSLEGSRRHSPLPAQKRSSALHATASEKPSKDKKHTKDKDEKRDKKAGK